LIEIRIPGASSTRFVKIAMPTLFLVFAVFLR